MTQGIYKLVNNINNRVYIGQSTDIELRYESHLNMLMSNRHHSYKFQNFFNYNKEKVIIDFEVLEEITRKEDLLLREKYYISLYDSCNNGYNIINTNIKYYDSKTKRYIELEDAKAEFDYLTTKYKDNLILSRKEYSYSFLYRINECIKFFIKNYNLDLYMCEIQQTSFNVTMDVTGIHSKYYKPYKYNSKTNQVEVYYEVMKDAINYKDIFFKEGTGTKFSNNHKSRRKYIWFMKRLAMFDKDIIKYNVSTLKDKYLIPLKIIKETIGYNDDNFVRDVLLDDNVRNISNALGIIYVKGKGVYIEIEQNIKTTAKAMAH